MSNDNNDIRAAVIKNCPGFEKADDTQIMTRWGSLGKATQAKYMASVAAKQSVGNNKNTKGTSDAGNGSK